VLQWWLLRANAESEAEYNTIVKGMSKQLEEGKKDIWEAHEQVSEIVRDSENVENQSVPNSNHQKQLASNTNNKRQQQPIIEKTDPKPKATVVIATKVVTVASTRPTRIKKPTAVAAAAAAPENSTAAAVSAPPASKKPDTIHIDIVGGPYDGTFYDLQPKTRSHSWVGRSSSTKFKDRGISLPLDLEVSTSHGRFEFKQGKFYYTDVASTNGTRINGEDCVPNHPYELEANGITILAGQTSMNVTLLKLA
jgi:pSer/pThr/pTyr-binding forkhead associated (FHA) protein